MFDNELTIKLGNHIQKHSSHHIQLLLTISRLLKLKKKDEFGCEHHLSLSLYCTVTHTSINLINDREIQNKREENEKRVRVRGVQREYLKEEIEDDR